MNMLRRSAIWLAALAAAALITAGSALAAPEDAPVLFTASSADLACCDALEFTDEQYGDISAALIAGLRAYAGGEAWDGEVDEHGYPVTSADDFCVTIGNEWFTIAGQEDFNAFNAAFSSLYFNTIYENPDIFYCFTQYSISYDGSFIVYPLVIPEFKNTSENSAVFSAAKTAFDAAVEAVVSDCISDTTMTGVEKALALHDRLIELCEYNQNVANNIEPPTLKVYSPYGALVDGDAVCQGYAIAYNLLMSRAGVECAVATNAWHAWNIVKLGSGYYHVDATFDDPAPDIPGHASHEFFLLSDATVRARDTSGMHALWTTRGGYTCSDASFETGWPWCGETKPFTYDRRDGLFYFVKDLKNGEYISGAEYCSAAIAETAAGCTVTTIKSGLGYVSASLRCGKLLYYTSWGKVMRYDPATGETATIRPSDASGYHIGILRRGDKLVVRKNYADIASYDLPPLITTATTSGAGHSCTVTYVTGIGADELAGRAFTVANLTGEKLTVSVIVGYYDAENGAFLGCELMSLEIPANGRADSGALYGNAAAAAARVLVLDGSLASVCEAVTYQR